MAEVLHAATTVGYPDMTSALQLGLGGLPWAAFMRMSLVLSYVTPAAPDSFTKTDAYKGADPSEKGSVSYYLGHFAAKLIADRLLSTPWLWHYDNHYRQLLGATPTGSRPDLIGMTADGKWILVESKGRTNSWTRGLLNTAKRQATAFSTIIDSAGTTQQVEAGVAAIFYFTSGEQWSAVVEDPDLRSGSLYIPGTFSQLLAQYYQPLLTTLDAAQADRRDSSIEIDGIDFETLVDPDLDVGLAIASSIVNSEGHTARELTGQIEATRRERRSERANRPYGRSSLRNEPLASDQLGRSWALGLDGVAVRLGERWQQAHGGIEQ